MESSEDSSTATQLQHNRSWAATLKRHSSEEDDEQEQEFIFKWSDSSTEEESLVHQFENSVDFRSDESDDPLDYGGSRSHPLRPNADDCSYYLRTGTCKYGFSCKFNHPPRQLFQDKDSEDSSEKSGQTECKYYLRTGGCKYGQSCRYNHSKAESEFALPELNFLGLPIRLGEKECPFYMRNGSCGYGAHCRFHHPDLSSGGGSYPHNSNISDESERQFDCNTEEWNESLFPQEAHYDHEWNDYQVPNYSRERIKHLHPTLAANSFVETADFYMQGEEFLEREDQLDLYYFTRTGDDKLVDNEVRLACWFHNPETRDCVLNDNGLPLRPGKQICWHYEKSGLCKNGPACPFDHPEDHAFQLLDYVS